MTSGPIHESCDCQGDGDCQHDPQEVMNVDRHLSTPRNVAAQTSEAEIAARAKLHLSTNQLRVIDGGLKALSDDKVTGWVFTGRQSAREFKTGLCRSQPAGSQNAYQQACMAFRG